MMSDAAVIFGIMLCVGIGTWILAWFVRVQPIRRVVNWLVGPVIHVWEYRSPYARTCKTCGRVENFFTWSWSTHSRGWWEEMVPVALRPCGLRRLRDKK